MSPDALALPPAQRNTRLYDVTTPLSASALSRIEWPPRWQPEAIEALLTYLGSDERLRIVVGPPKKALSGTLIEGHVYLEHETPTIIHDRSGRPDIFPGSLLEGPVLRIELVRPRRRPLLLFAHPDWNPQARG
jgi:hypothetical protein